MHSRQNCHEITESRTPAIRTGPTNQSRPAAPQSGETSTHSPEYPSPLRFCLYCIHLATSSLGLQVKSVGVLVSDVSEFLCRNHLTQGRSARRPTDAQSRPATTNSGGCRGRDQESIRYSSISKLQLTASHKRQSKTQEGSRRGFNSNFMCERVFAVGRKFPQKSRHR